MPEIVEHGKSGLIVPNTVSEFANALSRIDEIRPEDSRKRAEYFRKGKGGRRMYELCKAALDKRWPAQLIPFTDRGLG
jgi:glycosyltransferase involved in cell wall biosynthesis